MRAMAPSSGLRAPMETRLSGSYLRGSGQEFRVVALCPHVGDEAIDHGEYMCDRLDFFHPRFSYEGADLFYEYHWSASEHRGRLGPQ